LIGKTSRPAMPRTANPAVNADARGSAVQLHTLVSARAGYWER
jgi:hypothetical protein